MRGPFTSAVSELGKAAWHVVRAALEKILASYEAYAATWELADDLLLTVPLVGEKKFFYPASLSVTYRDRFAGSNVVDSRYIGVNAQFFF